MIIHWRNVQWSASKSSLGRNVINRNVVIKQETRCLWTRHRLKNVFYHLKKNSEGYDRIHCWKWIEFRRTDTFLLFTKHLVAGQPFKAKHLAKSRNRRNYLLKHYQSNFSFLFHFSLFLVYKTAKLRVLNKIHTYSGIIFL